MINEYDNLIIGRQKIGQKITGKVIYRQISGEPIIFNTVKMKEHRKPVTLNFGPHVITEISR